MLIHTKRKYRHRQQGFTLIEVLIAIVLLAIGLLSMAQMQANGIRSGHGAYLRSQATILAADILDSMRANMAGATTNQYDINIGTAASGTGVANTDLAAWKTALSDLLPQGDGGIASNGNTISVTIQWADSRQNEAGGAVTNRTFRVDTTL